MHKCMNHKYDVIIHVLAILTLLITIAIQGNKTNDINTKNNNNNVSCYTDVCYYNYVTIIAM